jgi:hypothetical protein
MEMGDKEVRTKKGWKWGDKDVRKQGWKWETKKYERKKDGNGAIKK